MGWGQSRLSRWIAGFYNKCSQVNLTTAGEALAMWTLLAWLLNFVLLPLGAFMILLILIQRGKGGGLIGALGGAGGSSPFGSRAGDQFTRLTIYVAIGWLLLTMIQVKAIQYDYQTTARTSAFGRQEQ